MTNMSEKAFGLPSSFIEKGASLTAGSGGGGPPPPDGPNCAEAQVHATARPSRLHANRPSMFHRLRMAVPVVRIMVARSKSVPLGDIIGVTFGILELFGTSR